MSKEPQKYFVGNFVRHKKDNWIGIIHASNINYGGQEYVYCIARFDEPVDCFTARMYYESEVDELFDIIPYPWQEFFKVGDKVEVRKGAREGRKGTISDIDPDCVWPVSVVSKKEKWMDGYSYADLIKVGEA